MVMITNRLPHVFVVTSLIFIASCNLNEVGVLTVVNEDLGKSVLRSILGRFADVITKKSFNLEEKDGSWTYILKNLRVSQFSTNTVDVDFKPPELTTRVHVGGNIKVETDWKIKYKSWWLSTDTSGSAKIKLDKFNIYSQASIGSKDGKFTVKNCPSCCKFRIDSFDIDFTGFWGWLLDAAASILESEIKSQLHELVCESVNKVAEEATNKLISCQKTIIHETINKNPVTVDNSPVYMLGSGKCASLGFRGFMTPDFTPPEPEPTTPFYPIEPSQTNSFYTTESMEEKQGNVSTTPIPDPTDAQSTPPTAQSTPPTTPKKVKISKRDVPGGCPTIPGHNIAVRIEERVIQSILDTLHKMGFMDYKAVHQHQEGEDAVQFRQYWNGKYIGLTPPGADMKKPALYKDHNMNIAIKATEPPTIYINSTGIIVSSSLTTRVKIFKNTSKDSDKDLTQFIKLEIPVVATFVVNVAVKKVDNDYWVVPTIQNSANIGNLKISNSLVRLFYQTQIRRCIKTLIEKRMSKIVERQLSQGYPLAIPNILELDSAEIRYYEDYVEMSANVERVDIDF